MIDPLFIDEISSDYWYDEGLDYSRAVLTAFTDYEWAELSVLWPTQSLEWQDRLAYILGFNPLTREAELLIKMYRTAARTVALTALENLRYMDFFIVKQACISLAQEISISSLLIEKCNSTNEIIELLS